MSPAINLHRSLLLSWSKLLNRLSAPVDISFLVYFRIAFGIIVLWQVWGIFANNWVERYLTGKEFYFKYWPFYFVNSWPGDGMNLHVALLAMFAAFAMVGFLYRFSAAATFFLLTYIFLLDRALYLNHLYLTCLIAFVMIFLPAHRSLSVDALLRPGLRSTVVPAWPLWLLRLQFAVPMFFGGVAKINSDWLRGEPLRAWLAQRTDFPFFGQFFTNEPVVWLMAYAALLIDLFFILYMTNRHTRVFGFILVLAFHYMNSRFFDIGIFPWLMIAATAIFFEPDWPRRMLRDIKQMHPLRVPALLAGFVLGALIGGLLPETLSWVQVLIGGLGAGVAAYHLDEPFRGAAAGPAADTRPASRRASSSTRDRSKRALPSKDTPVRKFTFALLGIWVAVQILLPLRHFPIPGKVQWTEEGYAFSWHMMLRQKTSDGVFLVVDRATGEQWTVDPNEHLSPRQRRVMTDQPDMILQYAHHLEKQMREQGRENVEIRALIISSLNGREAQVFIDPEVDLTQVRRPWLGHADWIMPLTGPLRAGD